MKYTIILLLLSLFFSCADPKAALQKEIEKLTLEMQAEDFPSSENMNQIVVLYDQYIQNYPLDASTINYMELKAKYLAANKNYKGAVQAYEDILETFPKGNRKADALFMQAFLYQNNLADPATAKEKYQLFLEQYPDHELADDVRFTLENLYLSDEELLQKLLQLQGDSLVSDSL